MAALDNGTWMSSVSDDQAAAYLRQYPGFVQASSDPFQATAQTVRYMCSLINRSTDPGIVRRAWQDAAQRFGGLTGGSKSQCCWWYAKTILTFVHHQKLLQAWLGKADELQLLIEPAALLKMRDPKGDCAVYTTLICALLKEAGVDWEIVTVAVDPRQPGIFSHVYPRAILLDGRRLPLDASHGKFPGWEVPAEHVSLKQVWNESGSPIQDQDSGYRGLQGVNMSGLGCACKNDGLGVYLPDGSFTVDVPESWPGDSGYDFHIDGAPAPSSSGPSTDWGGVLGRLGSQWTGIVGQMLAPTTTYRSPNGAVLQTPANQTANAALLTAGGGLLAPSSASTSSLLPLLLLAGAGILVFKAVGK